MEVRAALVMQSSYVTLDALYTLDLFHGCTARIWHDIRYNK